MPRNQCADGGGDVAPDSVCAGQVCCRGFYGENFGFMPSAQCTDGGGDVAASDFCQNTPRYQQNKPIAARPPAPCVKDVESFFNEGNFSYRPVNGGSKDDASGRFRMNFLHDNKLPPMNRRVKGPLSDYDHMQGLVRIDVDGETFFVGVMGLGSSGPIKSRYDYGAMYAFRMGESEQINRTGKTLIVPGVDDARKFSGGDSGGANKAVSYLDFFTSTHPGGLQADGTVVAVPVTCDMGDCEGPSVKFYDFADPMNPKLIHEKPIEVFLDGDHLNTNAHWVAFSRLKDDRYLLFVNRGDNGLTDVFVTETTGPLEETTKWEVFPRVNILPKEMKDFGAPQNVSAFYECDSGQIYLLAQGPVTTNPARRWVDDNVVVLLKIEGRLSQGTSSIKFISRGTFERHGDYCQMGGASSLYITDNHEPVVYCSAGWASKWGKIVEGNGLVLKVSELTALAGDYGKDRVDVLD
ncbi:MAG: hypothetical protein AAFN91_04685 [Pseudomonadota bacterium]